MYENKIQFLMIKRKHSLGFVEFMRGKYPVYNYEYLLNIFNDKIWPVFPCKSCPVPP